LGVVVLVAVLINWFIDRRYSPNMSIPTARDILDKRFRQRRDWARRVRARRKFAASSM